VSKSLVSPLGTRCPTCSGYGVVNHPSLFIDFYFEIDKVLAHFPPADVHNLGQWFFDKETLIRLMSLMMLERNLDGQSIVCMATPSVSAALGLSGLPKRVVLLDIDQEVVLVVDRAVPGAGAQSYDFQDPLPDSLVGQFECFVLDPLYALDHYEIALNRAISLLRDDRRCQGYVVVPPPAISPITGNGAVPFGYEVLRLFVQLGLNVDRYLPGFASYATPPAESAIFEWRYNLRGTEDWRVSDLARVSTTGRTRARVRPEDRFELTTKVFPSPVFGLERQFRGLPPRTGVGGCSVGCAECVIDLIDDEAYYEPRLQVVPMEAWRRHEGDRGDLLFEVDAQCVGFVNEKKGELVVLQGPIARVVWEQILSSERMSRPVAVPTVARRNLVLNSIGFLEDYNQRVGAKRVLADVERFVDALADNGLVEVE